MPKLTPDQRLEVTTTLRRSKRRITAVAREAGVSRNTIRTWVGRRAAGDSTLVDKPRAGRPPLLDSDIKHYIRRLADKKMVVKEIQARVEAVKGIVVSYSTVRRCLTGGKNPRHYKTVKLQYTISRNNAAKRTSFCVQHEKTDKRSWISLDAALFRYDYSTGPAVKCCWMSRDKPVIKYKAQHSSYVLVYAAVSMHGVSPLVEVASSHKRVVVPCSEDFQHAMERLNEWARSLPRHRANYRFVMDNAKCHTSASSKEFLADAGIQLVPEWPAQSPDLNIIENLWSILRTKVERATTKDFDQFKRNLHAAWQTIDPVVVSRLYDSWNGRMSRVVESLGSTPVA
jgi:transposase